MTDLQLELGSDRALALGGRGGRGRRRAVRAVALVARMREHRAVEPELERRAVEHVRLVRLAREQPVDLLRPREPSGGRVCARDERAVCATRERSCVCFREMEDSRGDSDRHDPHLSEDVGSDPFRSHTMPYLVSAFLRVESRDDDGGLYLHGARLADPVRARLRLDVVVRVPIRVVDDDRVGRRQVEPEPARARRQQHDVPARGG